MKIIREKLELLADLEHERWSDWMKYLISQSSVKNDGSIIIPADKSTRWQRQAKTPYSELSENEKDSDRKEVFRYLKLMKSFKK